MTTEPPVNPFHEICQKPRTLEYTYTLNAYLAEGKKMPMQVVEGTDNNISFSAVAALYDRCLWFEKRAAEVEAERDQVLVDLDESEKNVRQLQSSINNEMQGRRETSRTGPVKKG